MICQCLRILPLSYNTNLAMASRDPNANECFTATDLITFLTFKASNWLVTHLELRQDDYKHNKGLSRAQHANHDTDTTFYYFIELGWPVSRPSTSYRPQTKSCSAFMCAMQA